MSNIAVSKRLPLFRSSLWCALLLVASVVCPGFPARAPAQEGPDAAEEKKSEDKDSSDRQRDNLIYYIEIPPDVRYGMPCLLLLVTALAVLIGWLCVELRRNAAFPPSLLKAVTEAIQREEPARALELCRADHSFFGQVALAGMKRVDRGLEAARQAASERGKLIEAGTKWRLGCLRLLVILAPLLGLIAANVHLCFRLTTIHSLGADGSGCPPELFHHVPHAFSWISLGAILSTTALIFYLPLNGRLHCRVAQVKVAADNLLTEMHHQIESRQPSRAEA